jgi:acetylornithine deacetylase/succinyl-diaminopimelate desuccinylase family protein
MPGEQLSGVGGPAGSGCGLPGGRARVSATTDIGLAVDSFLDRRRADLTELVMDLVRIDSQIPPYADERRIVAYLRERMASLGLGSSDVIAAEPERPNLVARIRGAGGGRTLMLNGHLDTKPVGDALSLWDSDPLAPELRDGRIYGLGTSDMKGAVAAMIYAAVALRESGATDLPGDLVLAFVADEEAGASLGSKFIASRLSGIDACLVGEPSGWEHDWQGLHLVSRGVCCFRIRVRGTQMHSSLSDRMPSVNAARRMAELLVALEGELELEFTPHPLGGVTPTLNVGVLVSGGVYFGVVPGLAEFACDLRTLPGMTEASVRASVDRWLDSRRALDPDLDVEVEFEPGLTWVPPAEIAADHPLVHIARAAAADVLGAAPPLSVFPGATDAPWFDAVGIPTIPSFGPGVLTRCHGPNEYVDVESVHQAARMYARIAAGYCGRSVVDG